MSKAQAGNAELSFDEMMRARQTFLKHTDEYITSPFDLRTILSELGQYPPDYELQFCVDSFDNKMAFNNFTLYLQFLKRRFMKPEPRDVDTLRAFVALGGREDRRGDVNAETLRETIKHFDLTIDIDAMISEVDEDNSGKLEFGEFKSMWGASDEKPPSDEAQRATSRLSVTKVSGMDLEFLRDPEMAAPPAPQNTEDVPELTEQENIDMLRTHFFPSQKKQGDNIRKATKKASMLPSSRLMPSMTGSTFQATAVAADKEKKDQSESDSDADDHPALQRNLYKPPSPVILSLRTLKSTKVSSLTPRGGKHSPRKSSRSPRKTPR